MSISGITSGMAGTAGMMMGVGDVPTLPQRDMLNELMTSIKAQSGAAPAQLAAEREFQPQYTQLATETAGQGAQGVMSILQMIQPQVDALNNAHRQTSLANIAALGPQADAAWRASNPQLASLLDAVTSNAGRDLGYGTTLSPEMANNLSQSYRTAQAARGLGTGRGDAGMEAYYQQREGQNMYQQRMGNASSAAQLSASTRPDPLATLFGISPAVTATAAMSAGGSLAGNARPRLFDPINQYAEDLFNTNNNAVATQLLGTTNNNLNLLSAGGRGAGSSNGSNLNSIMSMFGSRGGGGGGGSSGLDMNGSVGANSFNYGGY